MSSSERNTLRFAVGNPNEYRSAVWRLWAKGNDVYLTGRVFGGLIKFSLHEAGIWQWAYTKESRIQAQRSSERVIRHWQRPAEFWPGWTKGPVVIVPNSGIQKPFRHSPHEDFGRVIWSPTPKLGYQHFFTVLFASAQASADSWQIVTRPDDICLGTLNLKNSNMVVLCRREAVMRDEESSYVTSFVQDMQINYPREAPEVYGASAFFPGKDNEDPYLVDMALGWENVKDAKNQELDL